LFIRIKASIRDFGSKGTSTGLERKKKCGEKEPYNVYYKEGKRCNS